MIGRQPVMRSTPDDLPPNRTRSVYSGPIDRYVCIVSHDRDLRRPPKTSFQSALKHEQKPGSLKNTHPAGHNAARHLTVQLLSRLGSVSKKYDHDDQEDPSPPARPNSARELGTAEGQGHPRVGCLCIRGLGQKVSRNRVGCTSNRGLPPNRVGIIS